MNVVARRERRLVCARIPADPGAKGRAMRADLRRATAPTTTEGSGGGDLSMVRSETAGEQARCSDP